MQRLAWATQGPCPVRPRPRVPPAATAPAPAGSVRLEDGSERGHSCRRHHAADINTYVYQKEQPLLTQNRSSLSHSSENGSVSQGRGPAPGPAPEDWQLAPLALACGAPKARSVVWLLLLFRQFLPLKWLPGFTPNPTVSWERKPGPCCPGHHRWGVRSCGAGTCV